MNLLLKKMCNLEAKNSYSNFFLANYLADIELIKSEKSEEKLEQKLLESTWYCKKNFSTQENNFSDEHEIKKEACGNQEETEKISNKDSMNGPESCLEETQSGLLEDVKNFSSSKIHESVSEIISHSLEIKEFLNNLEKDVDGLREEETGLQIDLSGEFSKVDQENIQLFKSLEIQLQQIEIMQNLLTNLPKEIQENLNSQLIILAESVFKNSEEITKKQTEVLEKLENLQFDKIPENINELISVSLASETLVNKLEDTLNNLEKEELNIEETIQKPILQDIENEINSFKLNVPEFMLKINEIKDVINQTIDLKSDEAKKEINSLEFTLNSAKDEYSRILDAAKTETEKNIKDHFDKIQVEENAFSEELIQEITNLKDQINQSEREQTKEFEEVKHENMNSEDFMEKKIEDTKNIVQNKIIAQLEILKKDLDDLKVKFNNDFQNLSEKLEKIELEIGLKIKESEDKMEKLFDNAEIKIESLNKKLVEIETSLEHHEKLLGDLTNKLNKIEEDLISNFQTIKDIVIINNSMIKKEIVDLEISQLEESKQILVELKSKFKQLKNYLAFLTLSLISLAIGLYSYGEFQKEEELDALFRKIKTISNNFIKIKKNLENSESNLRYYKESYDLIKTNNQIIQKICENTTQQVEVFLSYQSLIYNLATHEHHYFENQVQSISCFNLFIENFETFENLTEKALTLDEEIEIIKTQLVLSEIFNSTGDYLNQEKVTKSALEKFEEVQYFPDFQLKQSEQDKILLIQSKLYEKTAKSERNLGKYLSSFSYLQQSLDLLKKINASNEKFSKLYFETAETYFEIKNYCECNKYLEKSENLLKESKKKNVFLESEILNLFGEVNGLESKNEESYLDTKLDYQANALKLLNENYLKEKSVLEQAEPLYLTDEKYKMSDTYFEFKKYGEASNLEQEASENFGKFFTEDNENVPLEIENFLQYKRELIECYQLDNEKNYSIELEQYWKLFELKMNNNRQLNYGSQLLEINDYEIENKMLPDMEKTIKEAYGIYKFEMGKNNVNMLECYRRMCFIYGEYLNDKTKEKKYCDRANELSNKMKKFEKSCQIEDLAIE